MKKSIAFFLAFMFLFAVVLPVSALGDDEAFRFDENGEFRILQITDTQDDQNPAYDMLNLVRRSIEESQPDLIVFTGDIVEDSRIGDIGIDDEWGREGVTVKNIKGDIDHDKTLANIKEAVDALFSVLEESGIPYVIAQGNNDHKAGITNKEWLEIYSHYPNCIVVDESNDSEGRIDRCIPIVDKQGKLLFNLWIMDTGLHTVNAEQIEWYKTRSAEITADNGGNPVPAIVFQHVHIGDIGNLFEECSPTDYGATANGIKFYRLAPDVAHGYNFYAYLPGEHSDEFAAWKECGDVIGAFFGHQHVEGFSGIYDGIELGFTYGAEFAKTGPYGYRLITLHEDDITNYDNDLYVYEGKVRLGTDKITKQVDKPYPEDSAFVGFFMKIINFFKSMFSVITSLFG